MFTKKPEKEGSAMEINRQGMAPNRPIGPPQVPSSRGATAQRASGTASTIGADLSITGNLESKGEIQVEGEVQGDIHAARIIIGEHARITGALVADEVVVRGAVQGSIRGNSVTFQAATCSTGPWRSSRAPSSRASRAGPTTRRRCSCAQPTASRCLPTSAVRLTAPSSPAASRKASGPWRRPG